jgi:hypothetical protein
MEEIWCTLKEFKKLSQEYSGISLRTLRRIVAAGELGPAKKVIGEGCVKSYLLQLREPEKIQQLYKYRLIKSRIIEKQAGRNSRRRITISVPVDSYYELKDRQYAFAFREFIEKVSPEEITIKKRRIYVPDEVYQKLSFIAKANNCSIPEVFRELHSRFASSEVGRFVRIIERGFADRSSNTKNNNNLEGGVNEEILLPKN